VFDLEDGNKRKIFELKVECKRCRRTHIKPTLFLPYFSPPPLI